MSTLKRLRKDPFLKPQPLKASLMTQRLRQARRRAPTLASEVTLSLHALFPPEVDELEAVLNRDLSAWKGDQERIISR